MTNTKHSFTPGPWEVSDGNGIWAISPWNARFKVATMTTPSPMNGIDWKANAQLILTAPELLESLEELMAITRFYMRQRNECEPDEFCDPKLDGHGAKYEKANAVIAKANGG